MSEVTKLISRHLNERAEDFAIYLLGQPTARNARELRFFPKKGLSIKISGPYTGMWKDHGKGEGGDMLSLYLYVKKGATFSEAIDVAKRFLGVSDIGDLPEINIDEIREKSRKSAEADEKKRLKRANVIWSDTIPLSQTSGISYLTSRGITVSLPEHIRGRKIPQDKLKYEGIEDPSSFPNGLESIVWPAYDQSGELRAVQQVYLEDGKKAKLEVTKRTNGLMPGAAVRLGPPPRETLVLTEGPETGASVYQATGYPVWIVLGTSNLVRVEIPSSVREIIIAADREESGSGITAAVDAASFWRSRGYRVGIADPRDGDFNDVLQASGNEAVQAAFDAASFPEESLGNDTAIFTRSFEAAFSLWRCSGAYVRAFKDGFRGSKTILPEGIRQLVVARDKRRDDEDEVDIGNALKAWTSAGVEVRFVDIGDNCFEDLEKNFGPHLLQRLLTLSQDVETSAPVGYLDTLLQDEEKPIVVVPESSERSLAKEIFGALPVLSSNGEKTDWRYVSGRHVIITPAHSKEGLKWCARMISTLRSAGANKVWTIDWPACKPNGRDFEYVYGKLPAGYGIADFHRDGWRCEHISHLQQWLKIIDIVPIKASGLK